MVKIKVKATSRTSIVDAVAIKPHYQARCRFVRILTAIPTLVNSDTRKFENLPLISDIPSTQVLDNKSVVHWRIYKFIYDEGFHGQSC